MPVRSFNSPFLKWPERAEVVAGLRQWAERQRASHPELLRVGYFGSLNDGGMTTIEWQRDAGRRLGISQRGFLNRKDRLEHKGLIRKEGKEWVPLAKRGQPSWPDALRSAMASERHEAPGDAALEADHLLVGDEERSAAEREHRGIALVGR